jgi:tryptophanyl-tRNA synthetase
VKQLEPIHARRAELEQKPDAVTAVLEDGNRKARAVAGRTMAEVRAAVGLE